MFAVAICNLRESASTVEDKLSLMLSGSSVGYSIDVFNTVREIIDSGKKHHLYLLNAKLRETGEKELLTYVNESKLPSNGKEPVHFLAYADDPISNESCNRVLEILRRYLDYDSMYLCVEFLTEQGLKNLPLSEVICFEYINRKIRIKTHQSEFFCVDTLHNIAAVVGGDLSFVSPHKSFIVNMRHVANIKGYVITMNDGSVVPLSQKKSGKFRLSYRGYLEKSKVRTKKN